MSLKPMESLSITPCFPRVSGDEPENPANTIGTTKFSPRERG